MKNPFSISHRDSSSKARAGVLMTPHGPVETPVFMPVGTQGAVKTLEANDLATMGYQIMLSNTYHLFLRPGENILKKAGGLHKFMGWNNSILTDSGGYQVLSLAARCKMSEEGVEFSSHVDGARCWLTPEITTSFQFGIGSDIAMCLDDCPPYPSLENDARESLERTRRWAARCKTEYAKWTEGRDVPQLLFGISQGASFPALRKLSAEHMVEIGFPGYAIGGLGVGEPRPLTLELLEASLEKLPDQSPHYLMGFGQPEDMWEGVERGVDMFDCVLPTRNGRNGQAFTSEGRVNVVNGAYREDFSPLDPACSCPVCKNHTRAYLCHLFRAGEMVAPRLVTLHNLSYMIGLLRTIRTSIINGNFQTSKQEFFRRYNHETARVS
jgi:queuine tRNA-ribosyltransferase